jgi:hypothetical protein
MVGGQRLLAQLERALGQQNRLTSFACVEKIGGASIDYCGFISLALR